MRCADFDAGIDSRKRWQIAARSLPVGVITTGVSGANVTRFRLCPLSRIMRRPALRASGAVNKIFSSTIKSHGTFSDRMTQHSMAWIERFTCDVCGKQQMSVEEKWWIAVNECAPSVDMKSGQPSLKLTPWDNALAHSAESKHLCGAG